MAEPRTSARRSAKGSSPLKQNTRVDWDSLEPDWRAGIKSVLRMATDYEKETGRKLSHTAINKHFKELGIRRDLSGKIKEKAAAIISASEVSGLVSADAETETKVSDSEIIETNATILATVQIAHRADVRRTREIVNGLLQELGAQSIAPDVLEQFAEFAAAQQAGGQAGERTERQENAYNKSLETFLKLVGLPSRAGTAKSLVDSLVKLVDAERKIFEIEKHPQGFKPEGEDGQAKSSLLPDEREALMSFAQLVNHVGPTQ